MLITSKLSMQFGDRPLFVNVNLKFDPNKRYGLVGANGAGKSTFLRILSGEEEQSEGEIFIPKEVKIGALDQDHYRYENISVLDVVLMGKKEIWEPLQERNEILKKEHLDEKDGLRLSALEDELNKHGANGAEAEVSQFLAGLGLNPKEKNLPMSSLSGGFKLRVLLAQLLWKNPDVLLLDEPTNHLDIASIRWLEEYLTKGYKGTLLLISHDRDFLNRVSTHIVDFDYSSMQMYTGNYESFQSQKNLRAEQIASEAEAVQKKIDEMQAFVDRFRAKASKARQAQSRAKLLEKMEVPDVLKSSRRYPHIQFTQKRQSGKNVLKVENIGKNFGNLQSFKRN
ncbi:MAG: ATP-binding cassette domain-containing protein [Bacteriovoracaceae bacterium]